MVTIANIVRRVEQIENDQSIIGGDCQNFWLVRDSSELPPVEDALEKRQLFVKAPGICVPYRRMKQLEFCAILDAINGTSRSVEVFPPDWSNVPEYMRPKND